MLDRDIARSVLEASRSYPVVAVTGPRQSGKTTLVRELFPERPYVLLEEPDTRRFATEDPRAFLAQFPDGVVLDEAQRAPDLFSYLQGIVDDDPRPGRFILTGSQQFGLMTGITQSLAGRVSMQILLPFSFGELGPSDTQARDIETLLFQGSYPPVHDRRLDPTAWYANYVTTYVERDVRQLVAVRDLTTFETFLRMCAARNGQLLNLTGLANDCGVSHNTARSWISILEASYIIGLVAPHFRNFNKRLVKSPKLYFIDTGLAAWLLDIRKPPQLRTHPMRGPLFESWVYSELLKGFAHHGQRPRIYFWRDRRGLEIDFLVDCGTTLVPIEVKSGTTFASEWLTTIEKWNELAGDDGGQPWLVHGGEQTGTRRGIETLPWNRISAVVDFLLAEE